MNKRRICSLLTAMLLIVCSLVYGENKQEKKEDGELPLKYNLADFKRTTKGRRKGDMESAWAIAFIDSLESNNITLNGDAERFSVNNLITTMSKGYGGSFERKQEDTGTLSMAIAYAAAWEGPVAESEDSYPWRGDKNRQILRSGLKAKKHIQEIIFLPERENAKDNNLIKEMIMKYGGVTATLWEDIDNDQGYEDINNAVSIIGWDDEYSKESFDEEMAGDGAFKVKKANRRTGYISYYDKRLGDKEFGNISMSVATRIDGVDNYDHIYQHDPLGYTKKHTEKSGDTVFFVNVFDIEDRTTVREKLKAVAFYTLEENLQYEIYMRSGLKSKYELDEMELIKKGDIDLPGYHTVDLQMNNVLYPGRKIVIGIKLISKDGTPSIALESPKGERRSNAKASSGESYMRDKDGFMVDITKEYENTNACIKIFTDEVAIGDEDTKVKSFKGEFMDISLRWLEDGIVVEESAGEFFRGDEVLKIGGISVYDLQEMLSEEMPDDDEKMIKYRGQSYFRWKSFAASRGLLNEDETVDIEIKRRKEEMVIRGKFTLSKMEKSHKNEGICSWNIEKENDLAYLKIDKWISGDQREFTAVSEKIEGFFNEVKGAKINNISIDIRDADGESLDLLNYILGYLEDEDESIFKGDVYVITSNRNSNMNKLAALFRENNIAKIVGEAIGIEPDIPVNTRKSDILVGRDTQLEKLREIVRGEKNRIYSEYSISREKGERVSLHYSDDYDIISGFGYRSIDVPFKLKDIRKVYLEDTVTHEETPIILEEGGEYGDRYHSSDEVIIPSDLADKTYHMIFRMKSGEKEYGILLDGMKSSEDNYLFGYIRDRRTDMENGVFTKYYSEHREDLSFSLHNENEELFINFDKKLKDKDIKNHVTLTQYGKEIKIEKKYTLMYMESRAIIKLGQQLPPGEGYEVRIPKDVIEFKDGTSYPKELRLKFVIPKVRGAIRYLYYDKDKKQFEIMGNQPMRCEDLAKIEIRDSEGMLVKIESENVSEYDHNITIKFEGKPDWDKKYTLIIPEGVLDFKFSGLNKKTLEYTIRFGNSVKME